MRNQPLVSIVVPIYNVDQYLDRCLKSIVNQTYKNLEIILIDDGSTDNSGNLCDMWQKNDERILVIHKENGGLSDARNAGMKRLTGEYVCFIDSDDWVDTHYVELLYKALFETDSDISECDYLVTEGTIISDNTDYEICVKSRHEAMKLHIDNAMFKQVVWNKLYKRSMININFLKGKYHEDVFWTYQIINNADKLCHISAKLYYYFQRDNSIQGSNYSIKRLDAVEGTKERAMFVKSHYPELSSIVEKQYIMTLMYHAQCLIKYRIENRKSIIKRFKEESISIGSSWKKDKSIPFKHKMWIHLFVINPHLTCAIRNSLNIGL